MRPSLLPPLFAVFAGFALLAGCAKRETAVEEGIRTRTLLVGNQNEPATLDPQLMDSLTDQIVGAALYEGLAVLDEKSSQPLPGVAQSWDATSDGLTYVFHLRANAKWSNGDPVTARDFAFAFERILSPAFGAAYSFMLWPIKNAEKFNKGELKDFAAVGVEVVDDHTLRLRLERPVPYLPELTAHSTWQPLHRASIEKLGRAADRANPWTRPGNLVGNGPFTLAEWTPNARVVVAKNPHYWGATHTWLERVIFFPTEKADTEDHNFRAGQVHLTYDVPKSKVPVYRAQSPSPLRIDPLLNITYLTFNVTKAPFTDPRVRRALSLAIDRDAISQRVLNGAFLAAPTMVPPDCGSYRGTAQVALDYSAARQLLAEAGFPGGRGLPPIPLQVLNDENQPRMAEAMQAVWQRELGVRVTIEPYEQKTLFQNEQTLSHTVGFLGWTADYADASTFLEIFRTANGQNWTGWSSREYDALLDRAAATPEPRARLARLAEAEKFLLEAAPVAPVAFRARTYLIHPAVKHWEPSPLGLHRFQLVHLEN